MIGSKEDATNARNGALATIAGNAQRRRREGLMNGEGGREED